MIIGKVSLPLDKINLKVIDQAQIIKAMEKGDIDVANDATGAMAKDAKSSNAGLKVLSAPSFRLTV